jgi:hypothetical protein
MSAPETTETKEIKDINGTEIGVYVKDFFPNSVRYYSEVLSSHIFQSLTESDKGGEAYRKGVYLTPVTQHADSTLYFRLLRCSSNLRGPTDNFRIIDHEIVDSVNAKLKTLYPNALPLNHVLAQIYYNHGHKKAKIKGHSDKTKDMPQNENYGAMAFCTFYDRLPTDEKELTTLRFRSKTSDEVINIPLHPGSVFFMPLVTNRFWTHEIAPSILPADRLPTRLGYVVRCSDQLAYHIAGQTYLSDGRPLVLPTQEGINELKKLYRDENITTNVIDYPRFDFSLNDGDYQAPLL